MAEGALTDRLTTFITHNMMATGEQQPIYRITLAFHTLRYNLHLLHLIINYLCSESIEFPELDLHPILDLTLLALRQFDKGSK